MSKTNNVWKQHAMALPPRWVGGDSKLSSKYQTDQSLDSERCHPSKKRKEIVALLCRLSAQKRTGHSSSHQWRYLEYSPQEKKRKKKDAQSEKTASSNWGVLHSWFETGHHFIKQVVLCSSTPATTLSSRWFYVPLLLPSWAHSRPDRGNRVSPPASPMYLIRQPGRE